MSYIKYVNLLTVTCNCCDKKNVVCTRNVVVVMAAFS